MSKGISVTRVEKAIYTVWSSVADRQFVDRLTGNHSVYRYGKLLYEDRSHRTPAICDSYL